MISNLTDFWLDILFKGSIAEFEQSGFKEKLELFLVDFSNLLVDIPASLKIGNFSCILVKLDEMELTRVNITIKLQCDRSIPHLFLNFIVPRFSAAIRSLKVEGDWAILEDISPLDYNRARIAIISLAAGSAKNHLDKDNILPLEFIETLEIIRSRHCP